MKPFLYSSIFGELTKRVQIRIDEASRQNKLLFDNPIYENYMTWDTPTIGFNFEEIIGKYNLSIAATTIDSDSKEPIRDPKGLSTLQAKNLTHSHTFPMLIQDYRKVLELINSNFISDQQRKQELMKIMFGNVEDAVNGVQAKLDMIFLGALSNEGNYSIDKINNPEGIVTNINYKMPSSNKGIATIEWIDSNIDKVDPYEDVQKIVDAAQDKIKLAEIWISQQKLSYILKTKKLKQVIFGVDKKDSPLFLSELNSFMERNDLPVFKVIRRQTSIKQTDGTLKTLNPFNGKNLVFVPAGNLGVIKNSFTNNELKPESDITYSNYGRIRISQWGVGEKQNSNQTEFIKAETIALPVFNAINAIYSLKTEN